MDGSTAAVEPIKRILLDLDSRFFPNGIKPGDIVGIRGSEGTGKTFLLTYFLARFLFLHPTKIAILVNTSHHFNLQNLISILSHLDPNVDTPFKVNAATCTATTSSTASISTASTGSSTSNVTAYLKRIFVINCFSPEDFLGNFVSKGSEKSLIERMLLANSSISAVMIDSIDAFLFLSTQVSNENRNILRIIRQALTSTATPLICTKMSTDAQDQFNGNTKNSNRSGGGTDSSSNSKSRALTIEDAVFTLTLDLDMLPRQPLSEDQLNSVPFVQQRTKEEEQGVLNKNLRTEFMAYLRWKSRTGTSIGQNWQHKVKYSVFSGMLWVVEDGPN